LIYCFIAVSIPVSQPINMYLFLHGNKEVSTSLHIVLLISLFLDFLKSVNRCLFISMILSVFTALLLYFNPVFEDK